jgi:CheY-like chemotaxis protein/HPt (histidine-containing phosphotransfer) domain-containing protein
MVNTRYTNEYSRDSMSQTRQGDFEGTAQGGNATRADAPSAWQARPSQPKNQVSAELEEVFRMELRDRLGAMKAAVGAIARGVDAGERRQLIDALIRHAHSLRGGALIVGLARLAAVAGALEKRLDVAPHDDDAARRAVEAIARIGERFGMYGLDDTAVFAVAPEASVEPLAEPEASGPSAVEPFRILHVEDGQVNRALVGAIFARARHPRVRACVLVNAATLAEARAILRSQVIDLVLLDVRLPDGDGLDLARDLRNSGGRRIPVVVVSAGALSAERLDALTAGGDKFISKPVEPAQLVATVSELAAGRLGGPT